jgi:DNA-binding CsgD family transcriptional regulator/energy-coupling factor transporter ATP-binding protein EcfA2
MSEVLGDMVSHLQHHFFVGREKELQLLMDHARSKEKPRIVMLHGIGGVGKSTLLDEFQRLAETQGMVVIKVDSLDFKHTKEDFCKAILTEFEEKLSGDFAAATAGILNAKAKEQPIILVIDTYEELHDLDNWLRDQFLSKLNRDILVVLSGRTPLKGKWNTSLAWRTMIQHLEIIPFSRADCKALLSKFHLVNPEDIKRYYTLTNGHPLTLTLAASLGAGSFSAEDDSRTLYEVLQETTSQWLRELPDMQLSSYIEATAIVRVFDHDLLEHILHTKITPADFNSLTSLSFIRKNRQGWSIHHLLRKSLLQEMQIRSPFRYQTYFSKGIEYLLNRIKTSPDKSEMVSELLYVLGDSHIRSTYLDDSQEKKYYLDSIDGTNLNEAASYVETLKEEQLDLIDEFYDSVTNQSHQLLRPYKADQKLLSYMDFKEFIHLGGDGIKLLKNENDEAAGLMVLLPINKGTFSYLLKKPVTGHYFQSLDKQTLKEINKTGKELTGWFIYHIDLKKDNSPAARARIFQELLSYLISGGLFVFTTPIAYMRETVQRIGFQEIPNSTHYDFGEEFPAPYYQLDLRGEKRHMFANTLVQNAGISLTSDLPEELHSLTPRELEVARMVLTHNTIAEIAESLYVTQITVKKHLSRLYEKLEVRGKAELIKKLYEIGYHAKGC